MDIIPPELLGDSSKSTDTSKKFDRSEFFPSSLTDGESNRFRLLSHYGTGHAAVYYRWPTETMKTESSALLASAIRPSIQVLSLRALLVLSIGATLPDPSSTTNTSNPRRRSSGLLGATNVNAPSC